MPCRPAVEARRELDEPCHPSSTAPRRCGGAFSQLKARNDQLPLPVLEYIEQSALAVRETFDNGVLPENVIDLGAHRAHRSGRGSQRPSAEGADMSRRKWTKERSRLE